LRRLNLRHRHATAVRFMNSSCPVCTETMLPGKKSRDRMPSRNSRFQRVSVNGLKSLYAPAVHYCRRDQPGRATQTHCVQEYHVFGGIRPDRDGRHVYHIPMVPTSSASSMMYVLYVGVFCVAIVAASYWLRTSRMREMIYIYLTKKNLSKNSESYCHDAQPSFS
jgi:hypothetical protein